MSNLYHVGIYCRVSVDDASNSSKAKYYIPADESISIENQRELLSKFVMLNGWVETKTYVDDGYSGGNFQRPGFLEMLEDARKGIINLILVKDLSRLGRDFVEVGRYADIVFPSLGCRFVSVLDCLDSEEDNTDMLHFRSLMNDYHLRDLSNKIRSVLRSKKQAGQFLATYAPYGYQKSEEDSHKLVIDEYAASIVRKIFDMRLGGMSYGSIAASLNRSAVLPPSLYRCQSGNGSDRRKAAQLWSDSTVKLILRNEVYLGNLCTNRVGTRSYKDRTSVPKPQSEWVRHEAIYEAIISTEIWDAVQKINEVGKRRAANNRPPVPKIFSCKLVCADCKTPMVASTHSERRKDGREVRYISYHCSKYLRSGKSACSWHTVSELTLAKIVAEEIQVQAKAVMMDETAVVEQLKRKIAGYDEQRISNIRQEVNRLQRRVRELEDVVAKLYEDKYAGQISGDTFIMLAEKSERERIQKAEKLATLLSQLEKMEEQTTAIHNWTAIIRKYSDLQEVDRTIVEELIDHIEVGERTIIDGQRQQDIKVFYRFVGLV